MLKANANTHFGLIARYQAGGSYYYVDFAPGNASLAIKTSGGQTLVSTDTLDAPADEEYTLRFAVIENTLAVYLNNQYVLGAIDDSISAAGQAGCWRGEGGGSPTWDDFRVDQMSVRRTLYSPAGRVLAEIDALGYRTSFSYDANGRRIATENALGWRTTTGKGVRL